MADNVSTQITKVEMPGYHTKAAEGIVGDFGKLDEKITDAPATAEWGLGKNADGTNKVMTSMSELGMNSILDNDPLGMFEKPKNYFTNYADTGSLYAGDSNEGLGEYMNPYLMEVLAPQLRNINRAHQQGLNQIDASQHMGGAFGDARHGIEAGKARRGYLESVGNATGTAFANSFQSAMLQKLADLRRKEQAEKDAVDRLFTGGTALQGATQAQYDTNREYGQDQLALGEFEQAKKQDAKNAEFNEARGDVARLKEALGFKTDILSGLQHGTQRTNTVSQPDNTGWAAAGSTGWEIVKSILGID